MDNEIMNTENGSTGDNHEQKVINVATFEDLQDHVTYNIEIERHDGTLMRIPVRELGYKEWIAAEREAPMPAPIVIGADSNGRPLYNDKDPAYKQARAEALERRVYLRMSKALKIDIPGDTVDEQIDYVANLPAEIFATISVYMNQMHQVRTAEVKARAESFHPGLTGGDADMSG